MKIKKYSLHILSGVLLLILCILSVNSYIKEDGKRYQSNVEFYDEYCVELDELDKEQCDLLNEQIENRHSFFQMFSNVIVLYQIPSGIILTLFVIIPSSYYTTEYLKRRTKSDKNDKSSSKTDSPSPLKVSYEAALIVPIILIILFIMCYFHTKTFALQSYEASMVPWDIEYIRRPFVFLTVYILNYLLVSVFYVNCTVSISKKCRNFFATTILSFLTISCVDLLLEVVLNSVISGQILKSGVGIIFNILSPITFDISYGYLTTLTTSFIVCLLSFVPVYALYKNKEK